MSIFKKPRIPVMNSRLNKGIDLAIYYYKVKRERRIICVSTIPNPEAFFPGKSVLQKWLDEHPESEGKIYVSILGHDYRLN